MKDSVDCRLGLAAWIPAAASNAVRRTAEGYISPGADMSGRNLEPIVACGLSEKTGARRG